jgi:restriction system protein
MIDSNTPDSWAGLQTAVAQVLTESGWEARVEHHVELARGAATLDVWAIDRAASPQITLICECKHWISPVPQNVIHGFRTVVADLGAAVGFIISKSGFQSGAQKAVAFTNIRLLTWEQFQDIFEDRWYENWFLPRVRTTMKALNEWVEPLGHRASSLTAQLSAGDRAVFLELLEKHFPLSMTLFMLFSEYTPAFGRIRLPLTDVIERHPGLYLPDAVASAKDFRTLNREIELACSSALEEITTLVRT